MNRGQPAVRITDKDGNFVRTDTIKCDNCDSYDMDWYGDFPNFEEFFQHWICNECHLSTFPFYYKNLDGEWVRVPSLEGPKDILRICRKCGISHTGYINRNDIPCEPIHLFGNHIITMLNYCGKCNDPHLDVKDIK